MKIYTSKLGRKFSIMDTPRPPEGEIVFFTRAEYEWAKSLPVTPEEFEYLWLTKKDDYRAQIIPASVKEEKLTVAQKYCAQIREMLINGKVSESEN